MKHKSAEARLRVRQRNKARRKLKHNRQIAARMKNEYAEYLTKMNNFEYHTWLSQVTELESKNNKSRVNKQIKNPVQLEQYDIISKDDIENETSQESCCIS